MTTKSKIDRSTISMRITMQGAIELSAVVESRYGSEYYVSRQYMGYTKKEAYELFLEHLEKE